MFVPDQDGRAIYESGVAAGLRPGNTLMFAHGFNIHYREITPPKDVDVSMVAPKSPGHLVRSEFEAGRGWWLCIRTPVGRHFKMHSRMRQVLAVLARGSSKPRSGKRRKPISLGSRRCSA